MSIVYVFIFYPLLYEISGNCNFETSGCEWTGSSVSSDNSWRIVNSHSKDVYDGPTTDHTLSTSKGNILFHRIIESCRK